MQRKQLVQISTLLRNHAILPATRHSTYITAEPSSLLNYSATSGRKTELADSASVRILLEDISQPESNPVAAELETSALCGHQVGRRKQITLDIWKGKSEPLKTNATGDAWHIIQRT